MTKVVTLTAPSKEQKLPQSVVLVLSDGRGRFLVRAASLDRILVFDVDGKFMSEQVPPQTRMIATVLRGPSNSLWIPAFRSGLMSILDGDFKTTKTLKTDFLPSFIRSDGTFIVSDQIKTPELIGYPLHLVDGNGKVVRSFGIDVPEYRQDLALVLTRRSAPAADGNVWAVAPGRYVLEKWNPNSGKLVTKVQIQSSWFKESGRLISDGKHRPNATIESLWENHGLVWFLLRDADSNWKPDPPSGVDLSPDAKRYEETYDWVLEAVNPSSGVVEASRRFSRAMWALAPPLITTLGTLVQGSSREIDVWQATVK